MSEEEVPIGYFLRRKSDGAAWLYATESAALEDADGDDGYEVIKVFGRSNLLQER